MSNSQHDLLFRIVIFVPTELSLVNFSTFKRILNHGFKTNGDEQTFIYPAKWANKQFCVFKCQF